jgi:hypothetical protein
LQFSWVASTGRILKISEGRGTIDFLGAEPGKPRNGKNTPCMALWKLLQSSIPANEKVEKLMELRILEQQVAADSAIIEFLRRQPLPVWQSIAQQICLSAPKSGDVLVIQVGNLKDCNDSRISVVNNGQDSTGRIRRQSIRDKNDQKSCDNVIIEVTNRPVQGTSFSSRSSVHSGDVYARGESSIVYFLKAQKNSRSPPENVAVKVPFGKDRVANIQRSSNDFEITKMLRDNKVPNVVQLYGEQMLDVRVSGENLSLVCFHSMDVDVSDRNLLRMININDLTKVAIDVLAAIAGANALGITHGSIHNRSNILYDGIEGITKLCGWSSGIIRSANNSDDFDNRITQDRQSAGVLFFNLAARYDGEHELSFEQVVQKSSVELTNEMLLGFNSVVFDPALRLALDSPALQITLDLVAGAIPPELAVVRLKEMRHIPSSDRHGLVSPPRYLGEYDQTTYPVQLRTQTCVDPQGRKIEQGAIYAIIPTPNGSLLGPYGGNIVTSGFARRLIAKRLQHHIKAAHDPSIPELEDGMGSKKSAGGAARRKQGSGGSVRMLLDGRPQKHGVFDYYYFMHRSQV